MLNLLADLDPEGGQAAGERLPVSFSDMNAGHLNHGSATLAVAAGVLGTVSATSASIRPGAVSGSDAVGVVERLVRLAGPGGVRGDERR